MNVFVKCPFVQHTSHLSTEVQIKHLQKRIIQLHREIIALFREVFLNLSVICISAALSSRTLALSSLLSPIFYSHQFGLFLTQISLCSAALLKVDLWFSCAQYLIPLFYKLTNLSWKLRCSCRFAHLSVFGIDYRRRTHDLVSAASVQTHLEQKGAF